MMSNGRTGAVNDAAKPVTTEKNASFAASEPAVAQSVPFRRGIAGKTIVLPAMPRRNGTLCATAGSDAANEAFFSVVTGFAASFTAPVRPLDIIDTGRWPNEPS